MFILLPKYAAQFWVNYNWFKKLNTKHTGKKVGTCVGRMFSNERFLLMNKSLLASLTESRSLVLSEQPFVQAQIMDTYRPVVEPMGCDEWTEKPPSRTSFPCHRRQTWCRTPNKHEIRAVLGSWQVSTSGRLYWCGSSRKTFPSQIWVDDWSNRSSWKAQSRPQHLCQQFEQPPSLHSMHLECERESWCWPLLDNIQALVHDCRQRLRMNMVAKEIRIRNLYRYYRNI